MSEEALVFFKTMDDETANRISAKYNAIYEKGIHPGVIIVGKNESQLLNGQKSFLRCKIIVDESSKSRCDVYGNEKVR